MTVQLGEDLCHLGNGVELSDESRRQGVYVLGVNGSGKSNLLLSIAIQDIDNGDGLCLIDPHGDLVEELLRYIPPARRKDVVYFDPADIDHPFGLNLLECEEPTDALLVDRVSTEVVLTFKKMYQDSWGPRLEDVLRKAVLTLIRYHPRPTLVDLLLFVTQEKRRAEYIARCDDVLLRDYWELNFPKSEAARARWVDPLINKLGRFLANPLIRNIVGQPTSSFKFKTAMDEGQIILVNLSKGRLGEENATLLGATLVGQLLVAALARVTTEYAKRRPFHLIVDEYHSFATDSFPTLQSEARKFAIDTIVAHQYRGQLDELNQGSTLNVGNFLLFRLTGPDAKELALQFDNTPPEGHPEYRPAAIPAGRAGYYRQGPDLLQLPVRRRGYSDVENETANALADVPNWYAYCKLTAPDVLPEHRMRTFNVTEKFQRRSRPEDIKEDSRKLGSDRAHVEGQFLRTWLRAKADDDNFVLPNLE